MQTKPQKQEDEISIKELIDKLRETYKYLITKWLVIFVIGIAGAGLGFLYAWLQPIKYVSRVSFVVEDQKSGVGGLAAIAGQFGFDIGGGGGGGAFSGDNILLFLKSESLCLETLLTNYDSAGREVLADRYAEANELKTKWAANKKVGQVSFVPYKNGQTTRLTDSLLQSMVKTILKSELSVAKPEKKASFIEVSVKMKDELLSKIFCERLVKVATDRYVESKIKIKALNVAKLQRRADSLGALLNSSSYSAAASQQILVDVNPGMRTAPVAAEISSRNKAMIGTIFAEVVKNLEITKVALSQETPAIQIVDVPMLPLKRDKTSKLMSLVVGGFITGLLTIVFLLVKRQFRQKQVVS